MNNEQIIMDAAIALGLYTEGEIENYAMKGESLPLHTYAVWKAKGMVPRKGVHGYEVRLWKKRKMKDMSEDSKEATNESSEVKKGEFFLTKAILFDKSQVMSLER